MDYGTAVNASDVMAVAMMSEGSDARRRLCWQHETAAVMEESLREAP
jgi:hypothetical protein